MGIFEGHNIAYRGNKCQRHSQKHQLQTITKHIDQCPKLCNKEKGEKLYLGRLSCIISFFHFAGLFPLTTNMLKHILLQKKKKDLTSPFS